MRSALTILITILLTNALGQTPNYNTWKEEAKENIRLLPEYGSVEKSKGQKEADEEFIQISIKQDGTRQKASARMIEFGFKYLYEGNLKTAMYRFNQAWLLDPENEDVYWGFGAVYFMFSDFPSALKQYDKGLSINSKSSNILTDKATIYLTKFTSGGLQSDLTFAIELFLESYRIDPLNQNTLFKLSACYFMKNDCKKALQYFDECQKLGGKPLTQEYIQALTEKCRK